MVIVERVDDVEGRHRRRGRCDVAAQAAQTAQ